MKTFLKMLPSIVSLKSSGKLKQFSQEYTGHNGSIKGCKFLGNDNYFITTGEDKLMKMWDRRAKKELKQQSFDQPLNSKLYNLKYLVVPCYSLNIDVENITACMCIFSKTE